MPSGEHMQQEQSATGPAIPPKSTLPVLRLVNLAAPYNPRKISSNELEKLRLSLREFGCVEPIVVNRRSVDAGWDEDATPVIVGGHQRTKAAEAEGWAELPCVWVDLSDRKEKALNLALNRISGTWDESSLGELLSELASAPADLALSGFDTSESDKLIKDFEVEINRAAGADANAAAEPDEAPPLAQPGDLILLGAHRLLCGDATSAADVALLLDGHKPALLASDPPYGVRVDHGWRADAGVNKTERGGEIQNDDRSDWADVFVLFGAPVIYAWHAGALAHDVALGLERNGYKIAQQIIWLKSQFALSRQHYHWQHEPCFAAYEPTHEVAWYARNEEAKWLGDRKQKTVWDYPSPIRGSVGGQATSHPTQKPVELYEIPICNHTKRGEVFVDPFAGSGSALIAGERVGRRCFGMEIDPRWIDVAVRRWQNFTGELAVGWRGNDASC